MKRLIILAVVVMFAVASASFAESIDLSGTWTGGWNNPYGSGSVEANLKQNGNLVTGTIELTGTRTFGNALVALEGTMNGNVFAFSAQGGCLLVAELTFESAKKHDTLSGSFSCTGAGNQMTLYRKR